MSLLIFALLLGVSLAQSQSPPPPAAESTSISGHDPQLVLLVQNAAFALQQNVADYHANQSCFPLVEPFNVSAFCQGAIEAFG